MLSEALLLSNINLITYTFFLVANTTTTTTPQLFPPTTATLSSALGMLSHTTHIFYTEVIYVCTYVSVSMRVCVCVSILCVQDMVLLKLS